MLDIARRPALPAAKRVDNRNDLGGVLKADSNCRSANKRPSATRDRSDAR